MSIQSRNLAIDMFRARNDTAFQSGSLLRPRVMFVPGVMAQSYRFPVIGPGKGRRRGRNQPVMFGNIGNAKPTAFLEERNSFEFLDWQDQAVTNVDLMGAYGDATGLAHAREYDADILEVLGTFSSTAYNMVGPTTLTAYATNGTAADPNAALFSKAVSKLMTRGAIRSRCTIVLDAIYFEKIATDEKLTSSDYIAGNRVTEAAALSRIYNCTVVLVDNETREDDHGKIPDNRGYVFDQLCVGYAEGARRMGVMDERVDLRGWQVGSESLGGAAVIQSGGIYHLNLTAP